jgi:hypothetical protein
MNLGIKFPTRDLLEDTLKPKQVPWDTLEGGNAPMRSCVCPGSAAH